METSAPARSLLLPAITLVRLCQREMTLVASPPPWGRAARTTQTESCCVSNDNAKNSDTASSQVSALTDGPFVGEGDGID